MVTGDGIVRPDNGQGRRCICFVKIGLLEARLHRAGLEKIADGTRTAQRRPAAAVLRDFPLCVMIRIAVAMMAVGLMARRMQQWMEQMHPKRRSEHRCKGKHTNCGDCVTGLHQLSASTADQRTD